MVDSRVGNEVFNGGRSNESKAPYTYVQGSRQAATGQEVMTDRWVMIDQNRAEWGATLLTKSFQ